MIHSQVLSNGLRLVRDGKPVKTTPQFQRHLDTHYLRFAHQAIDSVRCSVPTTCPPPSDPLTLCGVLRR